MPILERSRRGIVPEPLGLPAPRKRPPAPFDIRLPWPLGVSFLVVGLICAVIFGIGTKAVGKEQYHGELDLFVVSLQSGGSNQEVQIDDKRVTAVAAIARSDPFMIELQHETGLDLSIDQIGGMVSATRPNLGVIVAITVTGSDETAVEQLTEHLPTALSATIDRYRSGLAALTDESGRNLTPGLQPDQDGPLYLQLFDQPATPDSQIDSTSPRTVLMTLLGFGMGVVGLAVAAGVLHERNRVSSDEDVADLLEAEQLGDIPRIRRRLGRRASRMVLGFANEIDGLADSDRFVLGVVGAGTERLVNRTTRVLALATGAIRGGPVVLVDLTRAGRRPRPGVLDVSRGDAELASVIRPIRRRGLPRWARRLGRGVEIGELSLGRPGDDPDALPDLASVIARLAETTTVVVALPTIPGPLPIVDVLAALDLCVLALLDGWTPFDDAKVAADALDAGVGGAFRFALIEN